MAEWLGPSEALCRFDELSRTEFFNDFLLRFNAAHALFSAGQYLDGAFTNLSVFRSHKRGPFEENDVELIRILSPHIKRAFRLHIELAALKAYAQGLQVALDSSPTAILLMDRDSRILAMNQAARMIVGHNDGLLVRHGRLEAEQVGESALLAELLSHARPKSSNKNHGLAAGMIVSRSERPPLQVLVAPVGKLPIALQHSATAIVFINDPEKRFRPPQEVLTSLFRLTPAECRVVFLLTDGNSIREIGEMIGVKNSTLKSQLKSIYGKTNTSRQSELIRLMMQFAVRVS
jgi:DNA-binding CsgD family transcriptional regulator